MLDPSISLSAGQNVPQIDLAGAALKGAQMQELATKLRYQEPLIQQEMAARAATMAATEEGTRKAMQEREEQTRQLDASRTLAGLYKDKKYIKPDGKVDHDTVYEDALKLGLPLETLTGLRTKVQTVRESDLTDATTRQAAKDKLIRQLDMEVAKSRGPDDTKGLISSKLRELGKLGMTPQDAQSWLSDRYGSDIANVPTQAQARLNAEMTPLKSAELTIAQSNLAISQAEEARRKREEVRGVGAGIEGSRAAVNDLGNAIAGIDKLKLSLPIEKVAAMVKQGWDRLVTQPGEMGAVARAAQAYEKRTGLKLDVATLGYDGVRAALSGEKKYHEGQLGAQTAGAPPALVKPPEKLVPGKSTKNYKGVTYLYVGGDEFSQSSWKKK